ncbi:DUF2207 family protein [Thomasclavelia cocleata]|uniref:DUF2207 family protein n=1 Tax=Thomasclavelia cocleata TaxID=69824 RepID=UPI0024301951|nr:DUF2207 domain-containing protein [Thomasclavelia cocleata]MCI9131698.1 DUF2207 domain-containing protein [Thomasclavelia cocleata]
MKLKKIILIAFICLINLIPQAVFAASNDLEAIDMHIYINQNGTATIKETWQMEMVEGTENYKAFNNLHGSTITDFSVIDEKGIKYDFVDHWDIDASRQEKKNKCGIVETDTGYELCYGIGDYGKHTYTMTYTIKPYVTQYDDAQGINWRLVNGNMDPKPTEFKATIESDYKFYDQDCDIWGFGYEGRVVFDDNGAIVLSNRDLDTNQLGDIDYVNLLVRIPDGTYSEGITVDESFAAVLDDARDESSYEEDMTGIIVIAMIVIGMIVFVVVIVIVANNSNKSKKLHFSDGKDELPTIKEVNPFRDIPCNKDIYYFYYVANKIGLIGQDDRSGILCAMLLKWIRDGYVDFSREPGTGWFKKDKYEIDFSNEIPTSMPFEEKMLGYFREASGSNQILENKEFERWCRKNYEEIEDWFKDLNKYFDKKLQEQGIKHKEITYKKVLGIDVKQVNVVYEPSFRDDILYTMGLKRFFLDFSSIEEKEVIEVKLWEEYLMFASILGIADKVEKQIGTLCPEFNQYSNIDYTYTMYATRTFMYGGIRSASAAYSAAHSSSYSGGGGSSSFGGGGGGFSGGGGGGSR